MFALRHPVWMRKAFNIKNRYNVYKIQKKNRRHISILLYFYYSSFQFKHVWIKQDFRFKQENPIPLPKILLHKMFDLSKIMRAHTWFKQENF